MSHVSPHLSFFCSLSIFLSSFSSTPHSPDELASIVPSLSPLFSLLSPVIFNVVFSFIRLHLTALTLPQPRLSPCLMMSGAVDWCSSPQWAHFTPPGLMPASQPDCDVTTDRQRDRQHSAGPDWAESNGLEGEGKEH